MSDPPSRATKCSSDSRGGDTAPPTAPIAPSSPLPPPPLPLLPPLSRVRDLATPPPPAPVPEVAPAILSSEEEEGEEAPPLTRQKVREREEPGRGAPEGPATATVFVPVF